MEEFSQGITLLVSGMTCGSCSASLTEALEGTEGIRKADVSLLTEEAKIQFDSKIISAPEIIDVVKGCGFEAKVTSSTRKVPEAPVASKMVTKLSISGMTCGACSAGITEALEAVNGVSNVSVSLLTDTALVEHDSAVTLEQLLEKVETRGFEATIESSKQLTSSLKLQMFKTTVNVSGMTCASCSASITQALESNPNVILASVSLLTNEACVIHNENLGVEAICTIIKDCGFEAVVVGSMPESPSVEDSAEDTIDDISMEIFGITEDTDLERLSYDIEAVVQQLPGIIDFKVAFVNRRRNHLVTYANSETLRAIQNNDHDGSVEENENLVDELYVTYDSNEVGIRDIFDALNQIQSGAFQFAILNSIDQSYTAQLKLLSRVKEIQYWKSNLFQALLVGIPVMVMTHTQNIKFWRETTMLFDGCYLVSLIEFALATYNQFVLAKVFNKKFLHFINNRGKSATMDVLVCISTSISYYFSVFYIFVSVWYGTKNNPPKLLFDTSLMLVTFISLGKLLENKAKGATLTALSQLMALAPNLCTIVQDPHEYDVVHHDNPSELKSLALRDISVDLIQKNDVAIVVPGAKVPADGIICFGECEIDESLITGESLPVFRGIGDAVIGGSVNGASLIHIKVTRLGKKSQLQQIINLVKVSQVNKAPVQRYADWLAARFVPTVLILALLTLFFWITLTLVAPKMLPKVFLGPEEKFFICLKISISVVVVACPCALGLAAPTAIMVGTGVGATHGVLIKGGEVLEKADTVQVILFDKTGTLTTGEMQVVNYEITEFKDTRNWWHLVAGVEMNSEHPIAQAIVAESRKQLGLSFSHDRVECVVSNFHVYPGMGVSGTVDTHDILVGNSKLVKDLFPALIPLVEEYEVQAEVLGSIAHVIIDQKFHGTLQLADSLKKNARDVVKHLQKTYEVGMVTGDNHVVAERIAKDIGIPSSNVFSEVSPIEKDKVINDVKERFGCRVCFIGDGINDAPALAQADVSMAISTGSDIAMESADIVILAHDDLSGVVNALKLASMTLRKLKMNFLWAAVYNIIMLPFAMGLFLKWNIMLPPIAAGCAMMMSSVSVVLSSLTLKWFRPAKIERVGAIDHEFKIDEELDVGTTVNLKLGTKEDFLLPRRGYSAPTRPLHQFASRIWNRTSTPPNSYELLDRS
ncbi:uncharacterized protein KQ657_000559 [Scheffersomyces spartinae]|uniref:P-type Cu(+) transporter n=1 Tax=Scheffersomyces spartinae TaxID=45513 RepID=A0A9P7V8U1_9ASCO|nr:uncharacterized protein KQ657_000559 [Scheffersomyces spartinae]KAG7193492.1 hypothetical protein KQ657_000559 [Scheffersomyces spartinae]